ncbi:cyclin-dependent kinase inhibitor 5 [Euphorbia lathyris]|uniref:cyclin-dependent kinase inhibitor 5 n=1 Tax=Euphorbia lathyris TaxID=212925 RepID=UPI0033133BC7
MGKYMRKAKTTGEVAVMDFSLGVRTRAKTLALQRQARLPPPPPPPPPAQPTTPTASAGYLQLRSRRLVKPPIPVHDSKRQKGQNSEAHNPNPNSNAVSQVRVGPTDSQALGSRLKEDELEGGDKIEGNKESDDFNNNDNYGSKDLGVEASFGENVLDIEGRGRYSRESTPCSLIRDPEIIRTPGSTTRPTGSTETNRRIRNSTRRHIPTAHEMDQFFAKAEEEQQRQFIEKYNFDPVNEKPLPGRYEWEKLDP